MPDAVVLILVTVIIVWLGALTFLFWQLRSDYALITRSGDKKTIPTVLGDITKDLHLAKKDIALLLSRCDTIEKEEQLHIQKIGLLRFNPFKDTGGDQSFILSLVDANDTGVVISGLYSRSGTRWYAKKIVKGKGVDHELSDEEKKAIQLASA